MIVLCDCLTPYWLSQKLYILSSTPTLLTNKFYGNTVAKLICTSPVRRSWFESQLRLLTPFVFNANHISSSQQSRFKSFLSNHAMGSYICDIDSWTMHSILWLWEFVSVCPKAATHTHSACMVCPWSECAYCVLWPVRLLCFLYTMSECVQLIPINHCCGISTPPVPSMCMLHVSRLGNEAVCF